MASSRLGYTVCCLVGTVGLGLMIPSSIQNAEINSRPKMEVLRNLQEDSLNARTQWLNLPSNERLNFVPQQSRNDYSGSKAVSNIQRIWSNREYALTRLESYEAQPEISELTSKANISAVGACGGLALIATSFIGAGYVRRNNTDRY